MKKNVNGHVYDTETARCIGGCRVKSTSYDYYVSDENTAFIRVRDYTEKNEIWHEELIPAGYPPSLQFVYKL